VPWLLAGIVLILLAIIVAQQLFNFASVLPPETGSDTLLLYALSSLNFAAFIVFSFILLRSLLRLRRERRERQPGSRIQTRLLVYFIGLSLLPITAMAAFSYLFLNRRLKSGWAGCPGRSARARATAGPIALQNDFADATLPGGHGQGPAAGEWQTALDQLTATGRLAAIGIVSDSGQVLAHAQAAIPDSQKEEIKTILLNEKGSIESLADGKDSISPRFR
jgi:amino acid transporter